MKVFILKHPPFSRDYYAINIFGIVLSRGALSPTEANHEYIHTLQQREMLFVFFYLWYLAEWLVKMVRYRSFNKAYLHISFEREAYCHQHDLTYSQHRRHFAWLRH